LYTGGTFDNTCNAIRNAATNKTNGADSSSIEQNGDSVEKGENFLDHICQLSYQVSGNNATTPSTSTNSNNIYYGNNSSHVNNSSYSYNNNNQGNSNNSSSTYKRNYNSSDDGDDDDDGDDNDDDDDDSLEKFNFLLKDGKHMVSSSWLGLKRMNSLYVKVPDGNLPSGIRECFVSLLEYVEETLQVATMFLCVSKDRNDRAELLRTFMFLGFEIAHNSTCRLIPKSEKYIYMCYSFD